MEAFADYAMDASGTKEDTMLLRMTKNSVDFDASPGAYDGDRLVGFTLIGLSFVVGVSKVFSVWRRQPPVDAVFATKKEVERSNRALDKRLEKVDDAVAAIHTDIQTAMASISLNSAERARRIR